MIKTKVTNVIDQKFDGFYAANTDSSIPDRFRETLKDVFFAGVYTTYRLISDSINDGTDKISDNLDHYYNIERPIADKKRREALVAAAVDDEAVVKAAAKLDVSKMN